MKSTLAILVLMLNLNESFAADVKSLKLDCQGIAKVESVREAAFHPGLPPKGRFPGSPSSSGFTALVKVMSLKPGCEKLGTKYDLFVNGNTFVAHFGTMPALKQTAIEEVAKNSVGKTFSIKLGQSFGYTVGETLPLFPKVHSESLSFSGPLAVGKFTLTGQFELKPNINWVYSLKPVTSMSDIEKLSLAEETAELLSRHHFGNFLSLFLSLEPHSRGLKKAYAQLIWSTLHEIKISKAWTQNVLMFHVGGDGSFNGAPLATKFNEISQNLGIFSQSEIQDLIVDLPTWLLAGMSMSQCLNFTSLTLEKTLAEIEAKLPIMTMVEKAYLKDPMAHVAGKVHYVSPCTDGKVSAKAKALALSIVSTLH